MPLPKFKLSISPTGILKLFKRLQRWIFFSLLNHGKGSHSHSLCSWKCLKFLLKRTFSLICRAGFRTCGARLERAAAEMPPKTAAAIELPPKVAVAIRQQLNRLPPFLAALWRTLQGPCSGRYGAPLRRRAWFLGIALKPALVNMLL